MTPAEIIAAKYATEGVSFREVLASHLVNGYVFSGPDCFLMGRPVGSRDPDLWLDFDYRFPLAECDAWLVTAMAGDLKRAASFMPYPLPHLVYQRRGRWVSLKITTRTLQKIQNAAH